jgi:hypothetical protein
MRISYSQVQISGYNTCTRKYCMICPGGTKKKKNHFKTDFNFILNHILMLNISVEPEPEPLHVTAPAPPN